MTTFKILGHIEHVKSNAIKRVNFIKQFPSDFKYVERYRILYYAFIYPVHCYRSIVPYLKSVSDLLQKVHHKLLCSI